MCSPVNVFYLTRAFLDDQRERIWSAMLQFAIWPLGGHPLLIASKSAEGQARRSSWVPDVRSYEWPDESPVGYLAAALKEKGLSGSRLGVELTVLPAAAFTELREALPGADVVECDAVLERSRAIKTFGEVELLTSLARKTEEAICSAFAAARAGDRERDIAQRMITDLLGLGVEDVRTAWVGAGAHAATRRRRPGSDPVLGGDVVRADFGGWNDGMASDITRMAVVGPPSSRQRDIYSRVRDVQLILLDQMRPGAHAGDLYSFYRREVERNGLPFNGGIVIHSIGARVHEYPVVRDERNGALLEAGMVVAVEPTVTLPGEAKYTLEDLAVVTESGAVRLSDETNTAELFVITP